MKIIFAALILGMVAESAMGMNCSSLVKIESRGLLNYLGRVTFPAPRDFEGQWTLQADTDVPFTFLGGWGVWVVSDAEGGRATFRSRDENVTLSEKDEVTFRFRISWFTNEPKPEVINLKWEDVTICQPTGSTVEAIKNSRKKRTSALSTMQGRRRTRVNINK